MLLLSYEREYLGDPQLFGALDRVTHFEVRKEPIRHLASVELWDQLKGPDRSTHVYTGSLQHEMYFGEPLASSIQSAIPFHYFWGAYFELRPKADTWLSRTFKLKDGEDIYHGCFCTTWSMRLVAGSVIMASFGFMAAKKEPLPKRREFPSSPFPSFHSDDALLLIDGVETKFQDFDFSFTHPTVYGKNNPLAPTGSAPYAIRGRILGDASFEGRRKVDLTVRDEMGKEVQFVFPAVFRSDGLFAGVEPSPNEPDLQVYLRPPQ